MTKPFLYLVQSSSIRLPPLRPLAERPSAQAIFLTWDIPCEGAVFLERCTWGEGRNQLTDLARQRHDYQYAILLDDDVVFGAGSFDRFETMLLRYRPAVAFPVFAHKTAFTVLGVGRGILRPPFRCLAAQIARRGDSQMMAVHRDVLEDGLLFPVQTQFDPLGWWATTNALMVLLFNLYPRHVLQFNPVVVHNMEHRPYFERRPPPPAQREWINRQFLRPPDHPQNYLVNPFSADGFRRLRQLLRSPLTPKRRLFTDWLATLFWTLRYKPRATYGFTPAALRLLLNPDADLYRQYLALSPRARTSENTGAP